MLIPGEVFNKKIVDYLKFARDFAIECPGFETDIHGLVEVKDDDGKVRYFADCVATNHAPKALAPVTTINDMIETASDSPYQSNF